ncbi:MULTISPECIES: 1-propanol dehydrogenase PduQ [unclassified Luteococcus]|uniref:1-propanol dehydrogenase PduQ n=1 Tax=unclassified Luteococcus TaxID=2639923 RepID=UPI00313E76D6
MSTFQVRTELHHGAGSLSQLEELAGCRVLLVTDAFLASSPVLEEVTRHLMGCAITVFDGVQPNPSVAVVAEATRALVQATPEVVLALGGGSSIDTAKAVLKVAREHDLTVPHGLWVIPTTSGSGSEVTSFAVITEPETHVKLPLVARDMLPEVAILDAHLVLSAPQRITADTGMDVCTHAIEAYLARSHSDFTDALAEKAIQLVCRWLPRCYRDGDDLVARQHLHNASCLAGMAFENSGLGITHSLAHAIGGQFPVAHGRLNAILLPHTLAWNTASGIGALSEPARRVAWLGHLVGVPAASERARVTAFITAVKTLTRQLEIGPRITDHGVDGGAYRAAVPHLAAAAIEDGCTAANPVTPTVQDLEKILLKLL